ncbi:Tfp pilus assembly protein FimT/FimU [Corallococcus macrosporus]|uniref:Prepilin-type N-terminal cleavage/methylation domain-containing protein n=1 Tax=Myxococcus fulvus (strain ATCC BAA-855 / HW-1) TaxID=483219 RepID=F8CJD1_MYXFH|nr:prepilin-type N-terminal cleavage/methylation domain-containing protein [Corallococcus macrosporus]AEI62644.1 prepilin-type N-terminal cleavage/methylation domain-containing protein [Corallococcus macrosporus]
MERRSKGLTLLEVMVVVALVGLFATVSVASFQGMTERQRVSGAQRELVMMLQEARQKARATHQPVRLGLRVAEEHGVQVTRLRWEALACEDTWGTVCPTAACQDNACGVSGCVCPEVGPELVIPPRLDVSLLVGLCWMEATDGNSPIVAPAAPGGRACEPAADAPSTERLVLLRDHGTPEAPDWKPELVFQADRLTAAVRPVDCDKHASTPGCQ